jgi:hypothetical protein
MLSRSIAPLALAVSAAVGVGGGAASAEPDRRISGPYAHENLAIYLVHGDSAPGPVPLTLDEALLQGKVQVAETGRVNELTIENRSEEEVFIQAGDIVKGGRQDRVLMVSLLLPPRSGVVPISSFCVEQGRWTARGGEDATRFTSASEAMPSRKALAVMAAPIVARPPDPESAVVQRKSGDDTAHKQRRVWESVARTQADLAAGLGASVAAPQSATSLQLSLEHAAVKEARAPYLAALDAAGQKDADAIGYVTVINGRPVSADIYPSNGLFRKVWAKQLAAVVTEAIGSKAGAVGAPAPSLEAVREFMAAAERGKARQRETAARMRQETREADGALYNEALSAGGRWVHKSYLAK